MDETKIRWAGSTWNPMTGCTEVSAGCDNCYAKTIAEHYGPPAYPMGFEPTWRAHRLREPYKWKESRRVFVNSMSDLFHRAWTQEQIDTVFSVMVAVDRHSYLILTKRPERMEQYIKGWLERQALTEVPAHIWLGTSIENNDFAYRADVLRRIPVPIRFISAEPLLGPLDKLDLEGIAWLIVGGESGARFRPMDHAWARELRDMALDTNTAFFFKQSAAYRPEQGQILDGQRWEQFPVEKEVVTR